MTTRYTIALGTAALVGIIIAGCTSSTSFSPAPPPSGNPGPPPGATSYKQIELLSRPAVKEAFEAFASHDATNRSEPYADPTLKSQIKSFALNFRSNATASTLQAVLYPNVMKVDLSQNTTTASYLGYETGGATGSKFGGRGLDDDVIDISLGALFGNTLSALGLIPDDHKEAPCLTTDNVAYDKSNTQTFPYVQAPL
ncbi:MAG TPA: DUF4331 family protein [Candidatus Tumulicola sp.]|jgi:hypothetical protein